MEKKVWRDQKRSAKKENMPGGRKGLSRFSCINPELDSKSLTLSQPVLTDTQTACNVPAHVCCPPSQLSLFSTWAVWLLFVYCHSYSGPRFSVEHTLRLRKHRRDCKDERTPLKRISKEMRSYHVQISIFFLHLLNLKLSCPLAFLRECTCWKKKNLSWKYFGPFNFLHDGWCQQTQSNFSAEWWWALAWINLSSHKMKVCQNSCNQIR